MSQTTLATPGKLAAGLPRCPYQGLLPYSEEDAAFFFGRESDRDVIVANLLAARLTLLYGPSGVGKSSVLRAGVARHLRETSKRSLDRRGVPEFAVAVFNTWQDDPMVGLVNSVREAVDAAWPGRGAPTPTAPRLSNELLQAWTAQVEGEVLIILDQFEEYFTYHANQDGPGSFAVEFPRILRQPDLRVNVLLAIREDALAKLDVFEGRIPNLFDNNLRLEHLDREAARAAIVEPVRRFNELGGGRQVSVEPTLVEALLEQVKTGRVVVGEAGRGVVDPDGDAADDDRIETPYLQLVLTRLWAEEEQAGSGVLRLETLERLGGAESIVRTHVDEAMGELPPADQDVAAGVFRYLVTKSGTKIAHAAGDLAEFADVSEEQVTRVVDQLSGGEVRVLRPVEGPSGSKDGTRYEIFHDVLAAAVLDWRRRYVEARRRAEAERKLASDLEQAARRRRAKLTRTTALALVVLLVVSLVGTWAVQTARRQRDAQHHSLLLTQASEQLGVDPAESLHHAMTAVRQEDTPEAVGTLRKALAASQLRITMSGHLGSVNSATFSRDGDQLLTAGDDGTVRLWDAATGEELRALRGHSKRMTGAEFSSDGEYVTAGSYDETTRVWQASTGEQLAMLEADPDDTWDHTFAAFSPDGRAVLSWSLDRARIWEWRTDKPAVTLAKATRGAAFSDDGRFVVAGGADGRLKVWDWRKAKRLAISAPAGGGELLTPAFSPDGGTVVTVNQNHDLVVWRWRTGRHPRTVETYFEHQANGLEFSPDGRYLAAAGDKVARVWRTDTWRYHAELRGHSDWVMQAAWSPDTKLLATVSSDGVARIWEAAADWMTVGELRGHTDAVFHGSFSADGRLFVTASGDGTARIWAAPGSTMVFGDGNWVLDASFSPKGDLVVTASDNGPRVWEARTGRLRAALPGQWDNLHGADFSHDGRWLVTSEYYENAPRIWDWAAGKERVRLDPAENLNWSLRPAKFSPDGAFVVAGDDNGSAHIWEVATGKELRTLRADEQNPVLDAEFSPDGKLVVVAGGDRMARIWDAQTGIELRALDGHKGAVYSARFSPDGSKVVTAGGDRTVQTWDTASGRRLQILTGPTTRMSSAAFSPDGKLVVAGGASPQTYVWEAATGQTMAVLQRHGDSINAAEFSPDGRLILTASDDQTAKLYPCETCGSVDSLLALAEERDRHR